ncbi:MAG: hypothetical protein LC115_08785 [Bacteroidia bacterium]|nr:hypothetical protein [Bacteroidia bacterium]
MAAPTTYSEWTNLLNKFGNGDDTALEELSKGSFTVDAGTASRFYSRVEEVYKKRKQSWLDKFQRSFHGQKNNILKWQINQNLKLRFCECSEQEYLLYQSEASKELEF